MATNIKFEPGYRKDVVCSYPAVPDAGDPVRYGYRTGIALTDEDSTGKTAVNFGPFDADFSVADSETGGISIGDLIWFHDAEQKLNNTPAGGYFFGHANEAVDDGLTATISVHHEPSPGAGTVGAGTVGTTQLSDDGVTKAKIAADVAGLGLGQNVDGSLEVNVDDSTIEIATDTLRVADEGITAAKLSSAAAARAVAATIGAVTANAEKGIFVAPTGGTITGVQILNSAAIAADATDYWTLQLVNKGAAGAGTDVIAAVDTNTAGDNESLAEFVASELAIDTAKDAVAAGDVLAFKATKAASATSLADAVIVIAYTPAEEE